MTKMKFSAMAGAAVMFLALSTGAQTPDAASAPPPSGHGFGHGPMGHDEIGFLGFEAGFSGKTVTGAPFSASFSTESTETLADGNQIKQNSSGTIARDSQGRSRRDMTLPALGPWAAQGKSAPHVIFVNDPVARTRYILEADKRIARQLPEPPDRAAFAGKDVHHGEHGAEAQKEIVTTSLGTQTIGGVSAEGTRYTRTIPAGEIGNAKPIVIVTERWFSPDLQIVVMTKRSDPRSGDTTFQMTSIQRQEPAATMFQVPPDYTVKQGPVRGSAPLPPPEQ